MIGRGGTHGECGIADDRRCYLAWSVAGAGAPIVYCVERSQRSGIPTCSPDRPAASPELVMSGESVDSFSSPPPPTFAGLWLACPLQPL
ncbi:hypothetical protein Micbo1qcDRAFT_435 [Microdochium bolleyi]|uniref:Uncharacterized protein n=1 Tax=Microdochium bolleyi TaxID=196109 RepID=A0A136JGT4_9PEZI|nr:hypothetical protein Micbo1qcDRAFT_435 [Microdochium bolleyi]